MCKKGIALVLILCMSVVLPAVNAGAASEVIFERNFENGSMSGLSSYLSNPPSPAPEAPIFGIKDSASGKALCLDTSTYAEMDFPQKADDNLSYQRADFAHVKISQDDAENNAYCYETDLKFETAFAKTFMSIRLGGADFSTANVTPRDERLWTVRKTGVLEFGSYQKQLELGRSYRLSVVVDLRGTTRSKDFYLDGELVYSGAPVSLPSKTTEPKANYKTSVICYPTEGEEQGPTTYVNTKVWLDNVSIRKGNPLEFKISGLDQVYKPVEGRVSALKYSLLQGDQQGTAVWSLMDSPAGVSIDQNGIVSMDDTLTAESFTIKAELNGSQTTKTVAVQQAILHNFDEFNKGDAPGGLWGTSYKSSIGVDNGNPFLNASGGGDYQARLQYPKPIASSGTLTIEARVRVPADQGAGYVLAIIPYSGNWLCGPTLLKKSDNLVWATDQNKDGVAGRVETEFTVPFNTWVPVRMVVDFENSVYTMYSDGQPVIENYKLTNPASPDNINVKGLVFNTQLDDLVIYSGTGAAVGENYGIAGSHAYTYSNSNRTVSGVISGTPAETFLNNISFYGGQTVSVLNQNGGQADVVTEGCTLAIVANGEQMDYTIQLKKVIDLDFEAWNGIKISNNAQQNLPGGYGWGIPTGEKNEETAYIEAVQPAGRDNTALHLYSKALTPNSESYRHMSVSKAGLGSSDTGDAFVIEASIMTDNADAVTVILGIYKNGSGNLVYPSLVEFGTNRKISIFGAVTQEFELGRWYRIHVVADKSSKLVTGYIDGKMVYQGTPPLMQDLSYLTDLRAQQQFAQGIERNSYFDDFAVYPIYNAEAFDASLIDTSITSESLNIKDNAVNGFGGMTVAQVAAAIHTAPGARVEVCNADGTAAQGAAQKEMLVKVTAKDQKTSAVYLLDNPYAIISPIMLALDGIKITTQFNTGLLSASVDVEYWKEPYPIALAVAQYKDGKMIKLAVEEKKVVGIQTVSCGLNITETEGTTVKVFLMNGLAGMLPLSEAVTLTPYPKDRLVVDTEFYPGFKRKALTFSYDDYQYDNVLVPILNKYGLKCTFNLNSAVHASPENQAEIKQLYAGHEIANHVKGHPDLKPMTIEDVITAIEAGKSELEAIFGEGSVRGFVYPNTNPFRKDIEEYLASPEAGVEYVRPTNSTFSFDLPKDFMLWAATCKHDNLEEMGEQFLNLKDDGKLKLFYVWGHSWELNANPGNPVSRPYERWTMFENFAKQAAAKDDIWNATNIEICEYVKAQRSLQVTETAVTNPSDQTVYVTVNGIKTTLAPGETYQQN